MPDKGSRGCMCIFIIFEDPDRVMSDLLMISVLLPRNFCNIDSSEMHVKPLISPSS
jgi:hypothetical protein